MTNNAANKKIAFNTVYMYVRLFLTMLIGLYTSRVVLLVLGVSDYGLFNVVGGVLAMFTFISGSLSAATSRFFNVEMGKSNGDVNKSYNINLVLHIALAVVTFILAETVGLWYIYNELNVGEGKLGDALFVYHISIITACIGIINGPCASLFAAYERFGFLAKFDVLNTLLRLGGVILLQYYDGNALRFYAVIMSFSTIDTFVVYYWIARRDWPHIIKIKLVRKWYNYKNVLSFGGWNLLATMALMVRSTGCDLIINYFFNTAVNGAFAISKTINSYITTFSTNFDSASGPQIIQSYSAGNYERCNYLVNKLGRMCLLLFELIFFPLYIELDFILHLWLKNVPNDVLMFSQLNLVLAGVALTCGGLVQIINASGKIKWFKINGSVFFLLCVPVGYWLYFIGFPAYSILVLFIIADVLQRIVQLVLLKIIIGFDSIHYVKEAFGRPTLIAAVMVIVLWGHSFIGIDTNVYKLGSIIICFMLNSWLIYVIGLHQGERIKIVSFIRTKLNKSL